VSAERPADTIELSPEGEARRLWSAAGERAAGAPELVPLLEALDLGVHAAEILVIQALQSVKDQFPATIAAQLVMPTPEVDPHRDGIQVPKVLQFTDAIDLLSEDDLECVSPGMHRGWEDRRFACRRSRVLARETIGISLSRTDQEQLLLLAAYRNRLFRCPPPVRVAPGAIVAAWPGLERVMEHLLAS
jgi:hypothetical protein